MAFSEAHEETENVVMNIVTRELKQIQNVRASKDTRQSQALLGLFNIILETFSIIKAL